MAQNPSTRWFWNDWWLDPGVRACSVSARGLWIDMLALCAVSPRPGYLLDQDGKPLSICKLAKRVDAPKGSVARWIKELEAKGVLSRDRLGVVFNRRMVRDVRRETEKKTDRERSSKQLQLPLFTVGCGRRARHTSGFKLENRNPVSTAETVAARAKGKTYEDDPLARCARLGAPDDPAPKTAAAKPPPCRKSPALRAKIRAQLAAKHVRYLGARGRPGEAGAYLAEIDASGIPPPEVFDAIDRRMRAEAWDDMRTWKIRHHVAEGTTGPPPPDDSLAALLARLATQCVKRISA
jgi:DNA-binding Lrp family transcriptional regulator